MFTTILQQSRLPAKNDYIHTLLETLPNLAWNSDKPLLQGRPFGIRYQTGDLVKPVFNKHVNNGWTHCVSLKSLVRINTNLPRGHQ